MRTVQNAIFLAVTIMAAGCGGRSADTSPAASRHAGDEIEACHLGTTAPAAGRWITYWDPRGKRSRDEGTSWAHAANWGNAQERQTLGESEASLIEITCASDKVDGKSEIALHLATWKLKEQDVPFGPGSYSIIPMPDGDSRGRGGVIVSPLEYGGHGNWSVQSGALNISRFNDQGIAGSFSIYAKEHDVGDRSLRIEGSFNIPCRGGMLESDCRADKAIPD